jgi:hypothetical protein
MGVVSGSFVRAAKLRSNKKQAQNQTAMNGRVRSHLLVYAAN